MRHPIARCAAALLLAASSTLVTAHENGMSLDVNPGTAPGDVLLVWSGGQPVYTVFRSDVPASVISPGTLIGQTDVRSWGDAGGTMAPGAILFYMVDSSCQYNPPEICDGIDNDCDGVVDGPGSEASCNLPNATAACVAGQCAIAGCVSPFDDCDGASADGCEADLAAGQSNSPDLFGGNDVAPGFQRSAAIVNCGACGESCDDGNACTTDLCVPVGGLGQCRHYDRAMCAGARCTAATFVGTSGEGPGDPACAGPDSDLLTVNGTSVPAPDGLPDAWETPQPNPYTGGVNPVGVDINCDGVVDGSPSGPDLELPDSDPNRPDLYVSYDYMPAVAGGTATEPGHKPVPSFYDIGPGSNNTGSFVPGTIDRLVSAFASQGIALHMSPNVDTAGAPTSTDDPATTLTPHRQVVTFCPDTSFAQTPDATTFDALKAANFDRRRRFTHKYAVFGHQSQCAGPDDCQACTTDYCGTTSPHASGMAELGGNDLMITLGDAVYSADPNTTQGKDRIIRMQAGTFLHELGHSFGLNHGGSHPTTGDVCTTTDPQDLINRKPNHLSAMNTAYQLEGISTGMFPGSSTAIPAPWSPTPIDGDPNFIPASRADFSHTALPTLDENGLDESSGVSDCATTGLLDIIRYSVAGPGGFFVRPGPGCGAVDWNGDGFIEPFVTADINGDGSAAGLFTLLEGFDDWSFLFGHMPFQCSPNFAETGPTAPKRTVPPIGD